MSTEIEKLTQILRDSNNIAFFGGAGVHTVTNLSRDCLILEVQMDYIVKSYM